MASQPRVMAGMVWTLTLVALGGLGGVTGGFLQLLEMAHR
jgi:hypothetical protein